MNSENAKTETVVSKVNGFLNIEGELNLKISNYNGAFILRPEEKSESEDFTDEEKEQLKELPASLQFMAKAGRKHRMGKCSCEHLRGVVIMHTGDKNHLIKTSSEEESLALLTKISTAVVKP